MSSFRGIGYAAVSGRIRNYNVKSEAINGRVQVRAIAGQRREWTVTFPPMTRDEFDDLYSYIVGRNGSLNSFTMRLPDPAFPSGAYQRDYNVRLANDVQEYEYRNAGSNVTYNLTDHPVALAYNGVIYTSSSVLLEVGQAAESQELRINDMNIMLSGAEQTFIASFLNDNNFTGDKVTIYRAVVQGANTVIGGMTYFEGRISAYAIEESDDESKVEVTVTSHWADFEKTNNRKTNSNSQQLHFPNDLGFQYASKIVKDLRWGRKA